MAKRRFAVIRMAFKDAPRPHTGGTTLALRAPRARLDGCRWRRRSRLASFPYFGRHDSTTTCMTGTTIDRSLCAAQRAARRQSVARKPQRRAAQAGRSAAAPITSSLQSRCGGLSSVALRTRDANNGLARRRAAVKIVMRRGPDSLYRQSPRRTAIREASGAVPAQPGCIIHRMTFVSSNSQTD